MPPRTEPRPNSLRKPLRDLSNNNNDREVRLSKSANLKKKSNEKQIEDEAPDDDSTLLLVQSDLSSLLQKIDDLVVQALKVKTKSKQGRKEVESFSSILSDMLSTLKSWVPRFQKVLFSPIESEKQLGESLTSKTVSATIDENVCDFGSSEESMEGTLISPSPLVSWRVNCTIEKGRQLFLLTPLPMSKTLSSKCQPPSKLVFERITSNSTVEIPPMLTIPRDANDDLLESTPSKPVDSTVAGKGNMLESSCVSSPMFSKRDHTMLVMTPCLKMSPPKSCVLLEPISETPHNPNARFRRSTPFPVGLQRGSPSSESSSSEDSEGLAFKYPELLGIRQQACKPGVVKRDLESSPLWKFSPPKSCALLEPPDDMSTENAAAAMLPVASVAIPQASPSLLQEKENDFQIGCHQTNKSFLPGNSALIGSSPLWKEPESTFRMGEHPGENTLKKELWTRFEAASTFGVRHNASAIQMTGHIEFLEMLEEVSGDEENSVLDGMR